jgi:hypothetical protein
LVRPMRHNQDYRGLRRVPALSGAIKLAFLIATLSCGCAELLILYWKSSPSVAKVA